jgi:hypothetical protein
MLKQAISAHRMKSLKRSNHFVRRELAGFWIDLVQNVGSARFAGAT